MYLASQARGLWVLQRKRQMKPFLSAETALPALCSLTPVPMDQEVGGEVERWLWKSYASFTVYFLLIFWKLIITSRLTKANLRVQISGWGERPVESN